MILLKRIRHINHNLLFLLFSALLTPVVTLCVLMHIDLQTPLSGVTVNTSRPERSISTIMDGSYQAAYTSYFAENFPLRSYLVKAYDQILLSAGGAINGIYRGKHNDLHGTLWLNGVFFDTLSPEVYTQYEADLITINNWANAHNKRLVYFITPNKAEINSDTIPWNYQIIRQLMPESVGVRATLKDILERNDILYYDSTKQLLALKQSGPYEPFGSTGIHWNGFGAITSMNSLIELLNHQGYSIPLIEASFQQTTDPSPEDVDYYNMLNVYKGTPIDPVYVTTSISIAQDIPIDTTVYAMSTSYLNVILETFKAYDMPRII